jgi:hypothetical protein
MILAGPLSREQVRIDTVIPPVIQGVQEKGGTKINLIVII